MRGPNDGKVGAWLNNLAGLYLAQARYADAEPLFKRAISIAEQAFGSEHWEVGQSLNYLGLLYVKQDRYAEAEPFFKRSLIILEKALGTDHAEVGSILSNLALLYKSQGRIAEAEPLLKRSLSIREKTFGSDHPVVGITLNNLANLYDAEERFAEAEPLYRRALSIVETTLGSDHPAFATTLSNLAVLSFVQQDWARAAKLWRQSTDVLIRRTKRGTDTVGHALTGKAKSEAERGGDQFRELIKTTHRLAAADRQRTQELGSEMFQISQWALASEAAASLMQMAVRQTKGDAMLARLVRERQDLVGEWQGKDKLLIAARSELPSRRNAQAETSISDL
jgi:tetratricopeptide (TPR) repeat protein